MGVFVLHLGAVGVAYPSLISRTLSAEAVTVYCFGKRLPVRYRAKDIFAWDGGLLKKVMGIALPNGVENGVHQLVKVTLSGMVALFGTYQIAAIDVALGMSIGLVFRGAIFILRLKPQAWTRFRPI